MTEIINPKGIYKVNYSQFGGEIDIDDFNTSSPNKRRISKQAAADRLQADLNYRKEMEKYKNMTLEELKSRKIISNTDGRPTNDLTDKKWQEEFEIRKLLVTPYKNGKKMKLTIPYSKESEKWNEETQGTYYGCTNWQSYCSFINDILKNIRSGQVDYCYYIYQILDILKFHHDDLKTRYCDGYWSVWLERSSATLD